MAKMLESEMVENEDRWSFFDDETTEMLVELARFMMIGLVDEAARDLAAI